MATTLFQIVGTVVRGNGYGRQLGFPTANLDGSEYREKNLAIPSGVYAGIAELTGSGERFRAAIVIGAKVENDIPKIEAYLLDFSGDLYGKTLKLTLTKHLRPFRDFPDEATLKQTIATDVATVRETVAP